jgi:hypothetical protein
MPRYTYGRAALVPVLAGVLLVPVATCVGPAAADTAEYLNASLVEVAQVPGHIADISTTKVLYFDGSTSPAPLRVLDRDTGEIIAVPIPPERRHDSGWLSPEGVVFSATKTNVTTTHLYDWEGTGDSVDLGPLNSAQSPEVAGQFLTWSNGSTLYRRDLGSGENDVVAGDAGNWENDVTPAGDVAFWSYGPAYQIKLYRYGTVEQITHDDRLWNVYPVTDGTNTVYRKQDPCCGAQQYSTWLYDGTHG